jgi:hypothetical protein
LSLSELSSHTICDRVAAGWRKFWALKQLLLNRRLSLRRRLKLFDATVSGTVLWSCESWTPRVAELRQLETAQNAMLRRIVGTPRQPDEEWVSWIRRSTHSARKAADNAGVRSWLQRSAESKWSWAGHVARRSATTWLWRTVSWRDSEWNALARLALGHHRPLRPNRQRRMRWEETIHRFCHIHGLGCWQTAAGDRELWASLKELFASWCVER